MFEHQQILDKIELIKLFFESIGLKMTKDFPKENWNLDSSYQFKPIKENYFIYYNNEKRILLGVEVFIVGGLKFTFSGQIGTTIYETVTTDYDFNFSYEEGQFFKEDFRNFKLNYLLNENN